MNKNKTKKVTLKELKKEKGRTNWARLVAEEKVSNRQRQRTP
jgi:hypothetical protein